MKFDLPEGYEIEILDSDATNPYKQEAEWYRFNPNSDRVIVIKNGDIVATIEATGDMDIRQKNSSNWVRYSDDLIDFGITNDKQLMACYDSEDYEVVNNPWFEVWIGDDYSEPCFGLMEEAVPMAVFMIEEKRKENNNG
jgi:hypothetical protein